MNENAQPVGLDNGNDSTKAFAGENASIAFPSAVASAGSITAGASVRIKPSYKDSDGEYLVGEDAIRYGKPTHPALDSSRYHGREYRVTGMYALQKLGVRSADVVCGLPIGHLHTPNMRENVVRTMMAWSAANPDIRIHRVRILPEPSGAYFDKALDWNGRIVNNLNEVDVGIVDVGGHTIDIAEIRRGAASTHHVCRSEGMIHACTPMLNQLKERYPDTPFKIQQMPEVMRTMTVKAFGKSHNVEPLVRQAKKMVIESVKAGIKTMWPEGTGHLHCILLTGGPAPLLIDDLIKAYPHMEVTKDPQFANARGFYKFAVAKR